ncbi:tyrosine-type recombinase/integrase [Acidiphilium sp.]|uniref:tyrosine-type recombinase/integrase n=1 Tax=Acidiphilium sp. TaxID=527 RepID=UPI0025880BE1|nr:tyrosine-type recombinase/integrase [Acidiphilium sp.]
MPRKARDERLDTRTVRLKLPPRREPYWRTIQEGRAIGYRRLPGGKAGTWIARHYDPDEGRSYQALGSADDLLEADGSGTLTFAHAQARAAAWFREIERTAGRVAEPITVREAIDAYLTDYLARGGKAERDMRTTVAAHILPALGDKKVADLTLATIRAWHHRLAAAPARLRTGKEAEKANARTAEDADQRRARRSTANRVLTVLKAALSLAYREGRVPSDDAWRRVKPFANVEAPRVRYLSDAEVVRLVNACGPDLRALVTREDGGAWGESHQHRPLKEACDKSKISPAISFHILRHTAASRLVQRGVPMAVIAAFLGNTEAICARHYAHLAPGYVADTIRQAAGEMGIVPPETKVKPLRRKSGR